MYLAELQDVRRALVGVLEAVICFREALAVASHKIRAEVVVLSSYLLQGLVRFELRRKWEGLKAVRGGVSETIFERRSKAKSPDLMYTALQNSERLVSVQRNNHHLLREHDVRSKKS